MVLILKLLLSSLNLYNDDDDDDDDNNNNNNTLVLMIMINPEMQHCNNSILKH
jgi:hypothetical protein